MKKEIITQYKTRFLFNTRVQSSFYTNSGSKELLYY